MLLSSSVNLGKLGYQASIFSSTKQLPPAPGGGSDYSTDEVCTKGLASLLAHKQMVANDFPML